MFLRAAEAFGKLRTLRPDDRSLEAKQYFCQARAQIAAADFAAAIDSLKRSLAIDPNFACSYNALGVALGRLGRMKEAQSAFETAAKLTPVWALPPLQIAQQFIAAGDLRSAAPYLEKAAKLNPRGIGIAWSLARIYRVLGRGSDFLNAANAVVAIDRNYAPIYSELGMYYESVRDNAKAAQAFDNYLTLAPNFADSTEIRRRAQQNRLATQPKAPTLRRDGEVKRFRE
jgi:superkiller protein 3